MLPTLSFLLFSHMHSEKKSAHPHLLGGMAVWSSLETLCC